MSWILRQTLGFLQSPPAGRCTVFEERHANRNRMLDRSHEESLTSREGVWTSIPKDRMGQGSSRYPDNGTHLIHQPRCARYAYTLPLPIGDIRHSSSNSVSIVCGIRCDIAMVLMIIPAMMTATARAVRVHQEVQSVTVRVQPKSPTARPPS